jgi:hypothetical protein
VAGRKGKKMFKGLVKDSAVLYAGVKLAKRGRGRKERGDVEVQLLPENLIKFLDEKYEALCEAMYLKN